MKPVKLQFKGINSFSEQTEIDFENLIKNGIFGIFGDTGSGKSTILDCINFALYGKVERSKEKLDIINYRSEAAEVKFDFDVLTEGKRKRYSVERSLKKKSGLHKAMLYEDGACIADNATTVTKKITDVLGLDAEDFRKCIALPQGEFSQFVKSQPSERIALIERLFSLSKYGDRLKERLKAKESEAELNYRTLTAKLGMYSDVSAEILKSKQSEVNESKGQIDGLINELKAAEDAFSSLKLLGEKYAELSSVKKKLKDFEEKKPQMEKLRSELKILPICKTIVESDCELQQKNEYITQVKNTLEKVNLDIARENKRLLELENNLKNENFDGRIADCIALSAKYEACGGKPEKLALLNKGLEGKRAEYRLKEEEVKKLKSRLKAEQDQINAEEKALSDGGAVDLEQLINVYFKGAVLREEYVNALDYFVGLNGQVKFHKDNSELYEFISRELKQQIDVYKDRVYQVKDFSISQAREKLKSIQTANEEREKLFEAINAKKTALKDLQIAVNDGEKELGIIKRDGAQIRAQADEIRAELEKVFGELKDYSEAESKNSAELEKLKKRKASLNDEISKANETHKTLTANQASAQSELKSLEAEAVKLSGKINTQLQEAGFESVENCKRLVEDFAGYRSAEKALEEYDANLISLSARRGELEKTDGIEKFSGQNLADAEKKKNGLSDRLSFLRENLAVFQSEIKILTARLAEKQELQKQLRSAEKDRNLIAQLKELTKGNRFMEYIANEYLYDISLLASSTLLNLTDGRYFLTYKDNFCVGDNFNCGNSRGVNTLSGGETFLVSLSLALALSQTICSSLKSIEFFFLDEGFGTLDGTLVDTVINALEKLKSSRFTIGVISHVDELKHRIDSKITVNKATESHGSTVQLSC